MKRALSFILALTLALTLFPTFASATTAETTEPEYSWTPVVFNLGAPTTLKFKAQDETETPHEYTNGNQYSYGAAVEGENWKFVMSRQRSDIMYKGKSIKTVKHATYGKYLQISAPVTVTDSETNEVKTYSQYTFALKVPASGIYDISADVFNTSSGVKIEAVIHDQKKIDRDPAEKISIGQINNTYEDSDEISLPDKDSAAGPKTRVFSNGIGVPVAKTENWDTATNDAFIDTAIILNGIQVTLNKNSNTFYNFTFTPSRINSATVTVPANEYEINATFTPSVSLNVEGVGDKTYSDLDQAGIVLGVKEVDAGVSVSNNVYSVTKSGEVTFTPTVHVNGKTHEAAAVTINKQDEVLTGAFIQEDAKKDITESYVAPTVTGTDFTGKVFTAEKNTDGTFTLTAPEKNSADKPFLYWAKGMDTQKKIISFENVINNYVPAENGRNYLIAVYEGDIADTTNEYYNLNGQLIAKQADAPDYPSIPGLGTAEGWEPCGGNIFVAKYASTTRKAVGITAGDNCELDKDAYAYGDLVTCTANGEGKFKCWKKNGEIVSVDEAYSFNAWEDCNVEAVYENYTYNGSNMNILIDSFTVDDGVTGVMAEFIGFENEDVIEKGIKFTDSKNNEIKIPMTTTANQLAVIADAGKYEGYAILRSGDVYQMITDGSYEHN